MTNTYAISRLMIWAAYILNKDIGAQGWPKQSAYTKLVNIRGSAGFDPHFNEEAEMVDAFMTELKRTDIIAFDIVSMCFNVRWVEEGRGIRRAKFTGVSNQTSVADIFKISQSKVSTTLGKVYRDLIDFIHEQTLKGK